MLNKPVEEIVYENGKVVGVRSGGKVSNTYTGACVHIYIYIYIYTYIYEQHISVRVM